MDSTLQWVLRAAPTMFWSGIAAMVAGAGLLWTFAEPNPARPWMPAILNAEDNTYWLGIIGAGFGMVCAAWTRGKSLRSKYQ